MSGTILTVRHSEYFSHSPLKYHEEDCRDSLKDEKQAVGVGGGGGIKAKVQAFRRTQSLAVRSFIARRRSGHDQDTRRQWGQEDNRGHQSQHPLLPRRSVFF